MVKALEIDKSGERVVFIGDNDAGTSDWYAGDQKAALKGVIEADVLTDIKIIGFSEGAAATAMVLNDYAEGNVSNNAGYKQIDMAFMLETPDIGIWGFDSDIMGDLSDKAKKKGVRAVSITSSDVLFTSKQGWKSGDYSVGTSDWYDPWLEYAAYAVDPLAGLATTIYNQCDYHSDVTTSDDTYDWMIWELENYYLY
ncbi:hypothetical protein ACFLYQ_03135 [Chloroflexota bacterium]